MISEWVHRGRRDAEGIRRRGRWRTLASVRRYEKHGRMQQALARTPEQTKQYSAAVAPQIANWLRGQRFQRLTPLGAAR